MCLCVWAAGKAIFASPRAAIGRKPISAAALLFACTSMLFMLCLGLCESPLRKAQHSFLAGLSGSCFVVVLHGWEAATVY